MARASRCSACRSKESFGGWLTMRGRTRGGRMRVLVLCRRCTWKLHEVRNDFLEDVRAYGRYWEKMKPLAVRESHKMGH